MDGVIVPYKTKSEGIPLLIFIKFSANEISFYARKKASG